MLEKPFNLHLCQIDLTVGDIDGNRALMERCWKRGKAQGVELLVFPELSLIGYPPEDLIFTPKLQDDAMAAALSLATITKDGPAMLVGGVWREGEHLFNTVFLMDEGRIVHKQYKHHLPNYGVFDEKRVFERGPLPKTFDWRGRRIAILICEDLWGDEALPSVAEGKPDIILVPNASPFEIGKHPRREALAKAAAALTGVPVCYVNQVGGQDELVFDGGSFVTDTAGEVVHRFPFFEEKQNPAFENMSAGRLPSPESLLYRAMMVALRDYVDKNRFNGVVIGLSGGIDSALTTVIATDALGPERVHCVMLPSRFTSDISVVDATTLAATLGLTYDILGITRGMEAVDSMLSGVEGVPTDLARENIQSRLRGLLLMAISNSTGHLLITTGNKSEMAAGYATLYGDMCGAYSVLKDVYKTEVFKLSHWRNENFPDGARGPRGEVIAQRILTRAPSAELRENQKDEDSLPPYDILDPILREMVEERKSVEEIAAMGFDRDTVEKVAKMLYLTEYKRRQAPPGVKLTKMAFGRDRRFPLTNRFKL